MADPQERETQADRHERERDRAAPCDAEERGVR